MANKVSRKEEVFREKLPSGTPGSFLCDSYKLSTHKCLENGEVFMFSASLLSCLSPLHSVKRERRQESPAAALPVMC